MSWLRENPLFAVFVATTLLAGAALTLLMVQAMTKYHETLDVYQQGVRRLHLLQNRSPFPNAENLEKSRQLTEQYRSEYESLRAELAKMQVPINPEIKPQKFQDDLRAAVNTIVEKAAAAGVELPKGFYLGFDQYANNLPNEYVAPALARQLAVIEKVVTNLIDFKVKSIDSLSRLPLPEESSASPKKTDESQKGAEPTPEVLKLLPFDLAFTAEQGKLRVAFNSLLDSGQFLIVRNLALQNTARVGPPITRPSGLSTDHSAINLNKPETPGEQAGRRGDAPDARRTPSAPANLNVILGRELVKAALRIEIAEFPAPPPAKE